MMESDPASETSYNLNTRKTMDNFQHNIVINYGYFGSRYIEGLRAGRPSLDSRKRQDFLFSIASRPALEPTQPPIQWVPGQFLRLKLPGRDAGHSHLVSR
jgi:hypothetical protein